MLLATTKVYDKCQAPVGWLGLVIAVGTLAAAQFLDSAVLSEIVGRLHRVERAGRAFDLVVLPHPSGRSTWLNREENARLFRRSLKLIRGHEAWRGAFGT